MAAIRKTPPMPSLPIYPPTDRLLQGELQPGEKILWSSAPIKSRLIIQFLGLGLAGLLLTGLAVYAGLEANESLGDLLHRYLRHFVIFATIFGPFLLICSVQGVIKSGRIGYALTTDRAIVAEAKLFGPMRLQSFPAVNLGSPQRVAKADGTGNIILATTWVRGRHGERKVETGFFHIPDVDLAYATLLEVAKCTP
jgi:hypothetical protein